jgi:hypothetical protein
LGYVVEISGFGIDHEILFLLYFMGYMLGISGSYEIPCCHVDKKILK